MDYGNLFHAEIEVIENAQRSLDQDRIAKGTSAQAFQQLLGNYAKLFKQTRRLIKFSDRMQNDLNRLNQRLCRSESKYRNIFENAAEGIFRSNPAGRLIEVNPAMARMLGHSSPEKMLNRENDQQALASQDGFQQLLAKVRQTGKCRQYQTELVRNDGDGIWVELSAQPFYAESGAMMYIDGLLTDISERKRLHDELTRMAHTDELTGIFNRRRFKEKLQQEIFRARRLNSPLSLLMIDIDFFKSVNDRFGHNAGDRVLQKITATCQKALRGNDIFGRMGGEEFAVILPDATQTTAAHIAERLCKKVEGESIRTNRTTISTTISIGLCEFGGCIADSEALLKAADTALYRAKQKGRNQLSIHQKKTHSRNYATAGDNRHPTPCSGTDHRNLNNSRQLKSDRQPL